MDAWVYKLRPWSECVLVCSNMWCQDCGGHSGAVGPWGRRSRWRGRPSSVNPSAGVSRQPTSVRWKSTAVLVGQGAARVLWPYVVFFCVEFLTQMLDCSVANSIPSFRLSVCLSHSLCITKQFKIWKCFLQHTIWWCFWFFMRPNFMVLSSGVTPKECVKERYPLPCQKCRCDE